MLLDTLIEKIIFRPIILPLDYLYRFDKEFNEVFLEPEEGASINALHFKTQQPKGVILYFHGNKDNLVRWGEIASELTRFNYDVFVIDYRGYGKSTGQRTELNLYNDAKFCYNYLKQTLQYQNIIIYGRSLGTGIASWLAGKVKSSKLILETPYYDMSDLIITYLPWRPAKLKLNFQLRSYSFLKKSDFPILIMHGTSDRVVPFSSGKKLFDSLSNPNASFVSFEEGKHNDLSKFETYWKSLDYFILQV